MITDQWIINPYKCVQIVKRKSDIRSLGPIENLFELNMEIVCTLEISIIIQFEITF